MRGVSAQYGSVPLLEDICFDLHPSRTLALVGESDSGKSTMTWVIAGLPPPKRGEILLAGKPLPAHFHQRDKQVLRRIQMVYQMAGTALNPRHRVRETLGWPVALFDAYAAEPRPSASANCCG